MKPNFIILIVVILAAMGSAFYFQSKSPSKVINYAPIDTEVPKYERQIIADFTITRHSDQRVLNMPDDARGKVVLLNFWASWCGPCVTEFPLLVSIAEKYPEQLIFLGLSSDMSVGAMENFFKKIGYEPKANEWMVHDAQGSITNGVFQTFMLPETLLIDQKGYMVKKYVGLDWLEEDMIQDIENLLK
ncbi:MAG: TlpA disulfide reductase family protein [Pseudomonadota bacterium]|nr:hypothetical protein [Alphaproteobacteria bacterium]MEC7703523.1 TlpA disulfide reductase family protein [Pseudomonadota bacterium]MCS5597647.1 TlpA family protein disulfide reductase [Alphaproteobacteria bacterium]MEC9235034.1 TlpA disulfide reductase family protein [Pseudomonadota bacterium]MED5422693.1 TlpA disulfide reductase family protein [Pseudomonadota bacterium]|tara:strand:- start:2606 stop:3169 length:564 start_codon:yes stop_codon:yes gene_type:complete